MNQLLQKRILFKYIIPLIVFITFLSCGIWLWSSYITPWEYSYSNGLYSVTYTFYDRTYSWTQEYKNGTTNTGKGTFEMYSNSEGKYITLEGDIHYASGVSHKTFIRTNTHSLTTLDYTGNTRLEEVIYTCESALVFEVFCGLFISITGLYFITQIYFYYRRASKNMQNGIPSNNSNNDDTPDFKGSVASKQARIDKLEAELNELKKDGE